MTRTIIPGVAEEYVDEAMAAVRRARSVAALTGAGISVESDIPDFRSHGGLWQEFPPEEYATIDAFRRNPAKAWQLFRVLGETLRGAQPNPAHRALADLERLGLLKGIVTQNIDSLHQVAGSTRVIEIHGDHRHLQCLGCGRQLPAGDELLAASGVPRCTDCGTPLKPNVVLFGEAVRGVEEIEQLLERCDLLLVIGTSAQVYPAAALPAMVSQHGGLIYEFNVEPTALTRGQAGGGLQGALGLAGAAAGTRTDVFFQGKAGTTLPFLVERLQA